MLKEYKNKEINKEEDQKKIDIKVQELIMQEDEIII
jgi:hypothetical protein